MQCISSHYSKNLKHGHSFTRLEVDNIPNPKDFAITVPSTLDIIPLTHYPHHYPLATTLLLKAFLKAFHLTGH